MRSLSVLPVPFYFFSFRAVVVIGEVLGFFCCCCSTMCVWKGVLLHDQKQMTVNMDFRHGDFQAYICLYTYVCMYVDEHVKVMPLR